MLIFILMLMAINVNFFILMLMAINVIFLLMLIFFLMLIAINVTAYSNKWADQLLPWSEGRVPQDVS